MIIRPFKPREYFAKLLNIPDEDIDYSEIPPTSDIDWQDAEVLLPVPPEKSEGTEKQPTPVHGEPRPAPSQALREADTGTPVEATVSPIWAWNLDKKREGQRAYNSLQGVKWATPLLKAVDRSGGIAPENASLLWELKFAQKLHSHGISAEYEYATKIGGSSVDFRFIETFEWLVELLEIGVSVAAAEARTSDDEGFSGLLRTSPGKQSDEEGMILVQQKILGKVQKDQQPTKFPEPSKGIYHVILVDLQKVFYPDDEMLQQIAYGAAGLVDSTAVMCWQGKPIVGLFDPAYQKPGADLLRKRVHFVGFYQGSDVATNTVYTANPHLFATKGDAQQAFQKYPISSTECLWYCPRSIWSRESSHESGN